MGMKVENIENKILMLGDNYFESGIISIPAQTVVKAGAVLKRKTDGSFALAADGDELVAVNPFDIKNGNAAMQNMAFRPLIAGRVRADMLALSGKALTPVQRDTLRSYSIIPCMVTDTSQLDNQ
jgi:hypothetical protein